MCWRRRGRKRCSPSGASQLLKLPEFRDADKAHQLMSFLSDSKENLPVPDEGPMKILIGPENVSEALQDTSVVVASYDIGDDMRGLIGVVGPTTNGLRNGGRPALRLCGGADAAVREAGAAPEGGCKENERRDEAAGGGDAGGAAGGSPRRRPPRGGAAEPAEKAEKAAQGQEEKGKDLHPDPGADGGRRSWPPSSWSP